MPFEGACGERGATLPAEAASSGCAGEEADPLPAALAGVAAAGAPTPPADVACCMASGTNGQRFAFHGYLPIDAAGRCKRVAQLEAQSLRDDASQIFIETPYRNEALFEAIVRTCKPDTLLCIAVDLTADAELVRTQPVSEWKQQPPDLSRRPAVFLLYRGAS